MIVRALSPIELPGRCVETGDLLDLDAETAAELARLGAVEIVAALPAFGDDAGSAPGGADPSSTAVSSSAAAEEPDTAQAGEADARPKARRR